jgi:hypothetical protein
LQRGAGGRSDDVSESCGIGNTDMPVKCSVWRVDGDEGACGLEATETQLEAIPGRVPPWLPMLTMDSRRELSEYLFDCLERWDIEARDQQLLIFRDCREFSKYNQHNLECWVQ